MAPTPCPARRTTRVAAATGLLMMAVLVLTSAGCTVDRGLATSRDYKCSGDTDCLVGFFCVGAGDVTPGVCKEDPRTGTGGDCIDRDQDSFLAGTECPENTLLDCNDEDRLINPGRQEECDGVDNDCTGTADDNIEPRPCPLQAGVCNGAMAQCIGGDFQNCIGEGLYGPDFEDVNDTEESCDGLDNNCSGGYPPGSGAVDIDAQCDCIPDVTPPVECGTGVGVCERGIRFCQSDGSFTECLEAALGDVCVDDASCGDDSFCVDEQFDFREDLFDDCVLNSDPSCARSVCRTLLGTTACTDGGSECGVDQVCIQGSCQDVVQGDTPESCNGLDDDCNGRIDDGGTCQPCPFGMVLLDNVPTAPSGLCMDKYEASRPDATASAAGTNELYATSRLGVVAWTDVDTAEADEACRGTALNELIPGGVTQRFLCQGEALTVACGGTAEAYPYGETFQAGSCNDSSNDDGMQVTGDFTNCCVQVGATIDDVVCDLSGNASEVVINPFSGGFGGHAGTAEAAALTCAVHDLTGIPEANRGFRCCSPPNL